MKERYLKEETEADPLVVLVIPALQRILGFVHPRMCNVKANPLPEGTVGEIELKRLISINYRVFQNNC